MLLPGDWRNMASYTQRGTAMLTSDDRAEVKRLIAESLWSTELVDPIVEVTARAIRSARLS